MGVHDGQFEIDLFYISGLWGMVQIDIWRVIHDKLAPVHSLIIQETSPDVIVISNKIPDIVLGIHISLSYV